MDSGNDKEPDESSALFAYRYGFIFVVPSLVVGSILANLVWAQLFKHPTENPVAFLIPVCFIALVTWHLALIISEREKFTFVCLGLIKISFYLVAAFFCYLTLLGFYV